MLGFTYDDLGRRTALTRGNGVTTTYGYDGASRMNALAHDLAGTGSDVTYGFIYNPASQVGVRSISNPAYLYTPSAGTQALTRNGLNQPTSVNSVAMTSDARGNLTNDGVRAYTYDSANRMTGTGTSTLAYDPLDRLVEMTGTAGGVYLYDGDMITAVKVPASPTINNRLIRGPWPDELLVAYQGNTASTPLWSLQDHQASTIAIIDAAGTAPYTLAYDEYGQPRAGNAGRMLFTGQLWLPDFGLYHYKARAYHPGLGRFMQTDPVGYAQGMNLYAYVGLDPVNRTDPTGMWIDRLEEPEAEEPSKVEDVVVRASRGRRNRNARNNNETTRSDLYRLYMREILSIDPNYTIARNPNRPVTQNEVNGLRRDLERMRSGREPYATEPEAAAAAAAHGWVRVGALSRGAAVYRSQNGQYYTRDTTGHRGGAWKVARSPEALQRGERTATLDRNLEIVGP